MMKTGQVEKTSDRQYEVEERRYRTLESASLRLQKEAKGYLDSLRAMTASQMRIAETIDAFYGDSGATDGVSRSYKQAVEDLDAETVKALDGPYRCVPSDLRGFAWDEERGGEDKRELRVIEWEMNTGGRECFAGVLRADMDAYGELMDFVYRTTVLEPINRFCAYFPDINECKCGRNSAAKATNERERERLTRYPGIKKRNHKMLDYDSMRSKVKRLTEKPDKDPAKLPRTEKEQDMVSLSDFLRGDSPSGSVMTVRESNASVLSVDTNPDLGVPSPPKALNGIRQRLGLGVEEDELDTTGAGAGAGIEDEDLDLTTPSRGRRTGRTLLARTGSVISSYSSILSTDTVQQDETNDVFTATSEFKRPCLENRSLTSGASFATQDIQKSRSSSIYSGHSNSTLALTSSARDSNSTYGATWPRNTRISSAQSTPFFNPSELEDIMAPLKVEFMRKQADKLEQAKAAYDQLNEQLMSELPQLIDLRYVIVNIASKASIERIVY
jgi:hypothetical protein